MLAWLMNLGFGASEAEAVEPPVAISLTDRSGPLYAATSRSGSQYGASDRSAPFYTATET